MEYRPQIVTNEKDLRVIIDNELNFYSHKLEMIKSQ